MTEDEMVGWHHRHYGHEFEQTLGESEGQGSLDCCIPWSCKESNTTEQLNNNSINVKGTLSTYGNPWPGFSARTLPPLQSHSVW